jgi:small nuclear ribonucleoprotein (snRNP)-like protein
MGFSKHKDELILFLNKQVLISLRDGTSATGTLVDWDNNLISYEVLISNEPFIRQDKDIERYRIREISLISNPETKLKFPDKRSFF